MLVDTGDLSTFGDDDSLAEGQVFLEQIAAAANAAGVHTMHGNHDAWPEGFPLLASPQKLAGHRKTLRTTRYTQRWPEDPLLCDIPDNSGQVQLYGLNSVLHDRVRNTVALGEIMEDRYWETRQRPTPGVQLSKLENLIDGHRGADAQRHFRILATHHPVHYPPAQVPMARIGMVLANDRAIAQGLDDKTASGLRPKVHMVLSGHTHALYPDHSALPPTVRHCDHRELGLDQCQLVVGSLMQMDKFNKRGDAPHQAQVLRFYYAPKSARQDTLEVARLLAARTPGVNGTAVGPYELVPTSNPGQDPREKILCTR